MPNYSIGSLSVEQLQQAADHRDEIVARLTALRDQAGTITPEDIDAILSSTEAPQ